MSTTENQTPNSTEDQATAGEIYGRAVSAFDTYTGYMKDFLNKANDISPEATQQIEQVLGNTRSELLSAAQDLRKVPVADVAFGYAEDGKAGVIEATGVATASYYAGKALVPLSRFLGISNPLGLIATAVWGANELYDRFASDEVKSYIQSGLDASEALAQEAADYYVELTGENHIPSPEEIANMMKESGKYEHETLESLASSVNDAINLQNENGNIHDAFDFNSHKEEILNNFTPEDFNRLNPDSDARYTELLNDIEDFTTSDFDPSEWIEGTDGSDFLEGTYGDDVLEGGEGFDVMEGGEGFDTYIADDGDFINDSDSNGKVEFNGQDLSGEKRFNPETGRYEDDNFTYKPEGGGLEVTDKQTGESITIENWDSESSEGLGIKLGRGITVSISSNSAREAAESMTFRATLSRTLSHGEELVLSAGGEQLVYKAGDTSKTFTETWSDDTRPEPNVTFTVTASAVQYTGGKLDDVVIKDGVGTIIDDDPRGGGGDPLVVDLNKDGVISTSSLQESDTYFDITGDGLRERVGWIKGEDGLLAFDRNQNGQIDDGIAEVFGNLNVNGFEELKQMADSNYDNVIDRKDELYNQLQVWQDFNQDAIAQEGELQSLQEADIQSIELDYVATEIDLNGNTLSEASRYTDSDGSRELVADIQLAIDFKDTRVELDELPGLEIDDTTRLLPQFKGSGFVYDSLIQYNLDPEFRAVAEDLASNTLKIATDFETYIESYSGYTAYINELKERFSLESFQMHEIDKQNWIYSRFQGDLEVVNPMKASYERSLENGYLPTRALVNGQLLTNNIQPNYEFLTNQLESSFALQSVFKNSLVSIFFDIDASEFRVSDSEQLSSEIVNFFNNEVYSIEERVYLAHVLHLRGNEFQLNIDQIIDSVNNHSLQPLFRDALSGKTMSFLASESDTQAEILLATDGNDVVKIESVEGDQRILLRQGDDTVISLQGNQTYYFNAGDGFDTIGDQGGIDKLIFGQNIGRDDVIIKLQRNADLVIAVKEEGKTFDELTDKVLMVDWMRPDSRIEEIEFGDGSVLRQQDVFDLFVATDGVDVVELSSGNDFIDLKGGDDFIKAGNGNDYLIGSEGSDRLDGGRGNDTYFYNRGDGKDTIIDSAGHDTLQFAYGIGLNDLIAKLDGADLNLGLNEEGKTFDELSDVITLKNYQNKSSTIEAIYLDGYVRVDIDDLLNKPTEGRDDLTMTEAVAAIDLLAGDDVVNGSDGRDVVYGNAGNDVIMTHAGDDVLEGGIGSDLLQGGAGNDSYIFSRGDGKDTIFDSAAYGYQDSIEVDAGNDILWFGKTVTVDDIDYRYLGLDLIIAIKEEGKAFSELNDVITIKNYVDQHNSIEHILFSDGSEFIPEKSKTGTLGSDAILLSGAFDDLEIELLEGNDSVHTGSGHDSIWGNDGDDAIFTSNGDDRLTGGSGNDLLLGGSGNDIYVFNRGDGADEIYDDNRPGYLFGKADLNTLPQIVQIQEDSGVEQASGGEDTIQLGTGITEDEISFEVINDDLVIKVGGLGDQITVKEFYKPVNAIEHLLLEDGTEISLPDKFQEYVFNRGDGLLVIEDLGDSDTIINMGEGIQQGDLIGRYNRSDFVIALKEDRGFDEFIDKIFIENYAKSDDSIEFVKLNDGTEITDLTSLILPTEFDDSLYFRSNEGVSFDALAGNDYVTTSDGNDSILGGDGRDNISTSKGNDYIVGGLGNDELNGGHGDDTYVFNRGDGIDSIVDASGLDKIVFGNGVTQENIVSRMQGSNLILALKEEGKSFDQLTDQIHLRNFLKAYANQVEIMEFSDGSTLQTAEFIVASEQVDQLNIDIQLDSIELLGGDDSIFTGIAQDSVFGGLGNDVISTGGNDDTLMGDQGFDQLYGGLGNDTYVFNLGDGQDTVVDSSGQNRILFGEGIAISDIVTKISGLDLIIAINQDGVEFENLSDHITISSYLSFQSKYSIEFADGSSISPAEFIKATVFDDTINFGNDQVDIDLLAGDDVVDTGSKDDIIQGNSGNDIIRSGAGSDVISGGIGSDIMEGGRGNDMYLFNLGDDTDQIIDEAGTDRIVFGVGIAYEDLAFKKDDDNLVMALKEDGKSFDEFSDKISIPNWFIETNNIESIHFSDGEVVSAAEIAHSILNSIPDTLFSKNGAEMRGGLGDDTYVYKKGDFTVIIDDQYQSGDIEVNAGSDTLEFADINSGQVDIGVQGDDLVIKIDAEHDTYTELKDYVVIRDWQNVNQGIESIVFADGEVLTIDKTSNYPELIFDENWITSRYYIYGAEDNSISGSGFAEVIEAGLGNDVVNALDGNDRLIGQAGNDTLYGGAGNDVYVFTRGDGQDTVIDSQGVDTLLLNGGIIQEDVLFEQVDNDLVVALKEDGKAFADLADKIVLKDWHTGVDTRVEYLALDGQDVMAIADLLITPTEQNDTLEYGDENNQISALSGDDVIHVGGGNDALAGNDGNDQLYAGAGDDVVSGDAGTDSLYGVEGNDTYLFGRGDGQDTIIEDDFNDWGSTGFDTLQFKEGVSAEEVMLVQQDDDLVVGLVEEGKSFDQLSDKITLKKWSTYDQENSRDYSRAYYAVEQFSFADGTTWDMAGIIANINTDGDDSVYGFNQNDTLVGAQGNDELYGRLGDDTYVFNRSDGYDTIYDYGQKGEDNAYYDAGNDTLQFGEGISAEDLIFALDENQTDLHVFIREDGKDLGDLQDKVILKDWVKANTRVENFVLKDGTVLDISDYLTLQPTENDDVLVYSNNADYVDALAGDDIVFAQGGDDTILGNAGDDELQGEAGDDTLIGGTGNDVLDGGSGNDRLEGESGSDLYVFNLGDGHDIINDFSQNSAESDSIRLGQGVLLDDIDWIRRENDLYIEIDDNNSIRVENWFAENNYRIESVVFADDTVLEVNQIESRVVFLGDENDNLMQGSENGSTIFGFAGNDAISGNGGDDVIDGGQGDDIYQFNWGDGHDQITDSNGIDSIAFASGISMNDLYFKKEGEQLKIALYEEGKDFDTFSNTLTINKTDIEKIIFDNGDGLDVSAINLVGNISEEILELDAISTVYEGSLNEDVSLIPHYFNIISESVTSDSSEISGLSISIVDPLTGSFKVDGNFDALVEGEQTNLTFNYEVNYDSENTSLVSGLKEMNLTVTGTNDIPEITGSVTGEVIENSVNQASGIVTVNDLDRGESYIQEQFDVAGSYGVFNITNDGQWTYSLTETLTENASVIDTFTVTSLDGSASKYIEVSITGSGGGNNAPVIVPQIIEQRVSTNPGNDTFSPLIAPLNDGNYVVAWGNGNDHGGPDYPGEEDVYTQLYGSDGMKIGTEQLVNTYEARTQSISDMVALKNGGYVVSWDSNGQDGSFYGVFLQQFSDSGEKIGSEKQVNTYTDSAQSKPKITPLNDGGYVVAWESYNQDGSRDGVYLQQFSSAGEAVGIETQVNTYTDGNQSSPIITSLENDGYVVAWTSNGQDGSGNGVFLQQFDGLGNAVGSEQQVNTFTEGQQAEPKITALNGGGYVVVWNSFAQDSSDEGVYLQQFNDLGEKVGNETLVNSAYTAGSQSNHFVSSLNDGGYVVAWDSFEQSGFADGVYMQQFNAFGEKVGSEQQVNSTSDGHQIITGLTVLENGSFVVSWGSGDDINDYSTGSDIFVQVFNENGQKLGNEQLVNSSVTGSVLRRVQNNMSISALENDGFIVAFSSMYGIEEAGMYIQQFDSQGQRVGESTDPKLDFSLLQQQTITGNLDYIQDPEGDVLSYSASVENGDFVINSEGNWSYTPNADYAGIEDIVVSVDDGRGGVLNHTLTFNVAPAPIATPVVLDLNGDGVTSVSIEDSNAYFDYDGDGNREHTAWQEAGDAQLVADLNFDGQISDGSEIFGDYTLLSDGTRAKDGYEALEQYDSNGDRVIDNKDEFFGNLSLWQDYNQNGQSEAGELTNIQLSQVESIHLDQASGITFEQRQENGNIILNETNYIGVDGSTGIIRDVGFVYNALDTITNNDTLSTAFYGQSLSGEEGDDVYLFNAGDGTVTVDDKGDGMDTLVFGEGIAPDQLIIRWDRANNGLVIGVKENANDDRSIFDLNDKIVMVDFFAESGAIENFEFADGALLSRESLYQQYTALAESQALTARVLDANENLAGGDFADVLYGAEGEEKLEGFAGNDYLRGLSGDDYLLAGSGNDTLEGGLGDDTLYSESGDDYYIYNRGDGKDLIQDFSGDDRLVLGNGISADDVVIEREGYDLLIGLKEEGKLITELGDVIRIEGQFISGFQIEQIELDDGSTIPLPSNDEPAGGSNSVVPEIEAVAALLNEDDSVSGQLQVTGNTSGLIYEVVTESGNASFSIDENGLYSYTPSENYHGTDAVTIKVTNDQDQSATSTLTFDVESVNDAPVVNVEEAVFTLQDIREQNGEVQATDVEGDALSYRITTEAQHGLITIDENGAWNYKVDGYYLGEDSATITVEDGNGGIVTQTLKFEAKVSAPSLLDTSSQLLEDTSRTGSLNVINPMGGALVYEVVTSSENGSFSVDESGNWNYEPVLDFNGSDSVVLKVTNEYGLSTSSSLMFDIDAVNDIPVVIRDVENLLLTNIREYEGSIEASDVDGDSLLYSVQTTPNHGSIAIDEVGRWNYVADAAFNGEDSAVILIDDGQGGTVTKNLNFTVEGYVYQGQDLMIDDTSGGDTLVMDGIDKSDLQFKRQGDDLAIQVKDEATVTLSHYFVDTQTGVETLLTDQGEVNLAREAIGGVTNWFGRGFGTGEVGSKNLIDGSSRRDSIYGKHENDVLFGENGSDVLWGLGGDDTLVGGNQHDILFGNWGADTLFGDAHNDYLSGGYGNDTLIGGTGKDILLGGRDNDTLIGGAGNDALKGGRGDDLYVISKGDNIDTITESDGLDRIHFSEGVAKEDISFYMKDNNLHLQYGDNDRVTVQGQSQDKTKIERVELDDGSYLSNADIDLIIQQISAYSADSGIGQFDHNDIRNNEPMMQMIVSAWQQ